VFAWKAVDMPSVPWGLINHFLNVSVTAKPIKKKLQ
jgi:hypothetical protein